MHSLVPLLLILLVAIPLEPLALALPFGIDSWYSIQATVYGVVLFSLLVQAPSMQPLLRRSRLAQSSAVARRPAASRGDSGAPP